MAGPSDLSEESSLWTLFVDPVRLKPVSIRIAIKPTRSHPAPSWKSGDMIAGKWSCGNASWIKTHVPLWPPPISAHFYPRHRQLSFLIWPSFTPALKCTAAGRRGRGGEIFSSSQSLSAWDDKPYEVLPNGNRAYLDELDVVAFIDPPKHLIPLDPSSYNPASYLWKKIEDIPEERRHRLLSLLTPRLISTAWEIAGTRYDDPKLVIKTSSNLLSDGHDSMKCEYWSCRTSGGPLTISWINFFKKALFYTSDRKLYGRLIGDSLLNRLFNSIWPLYFTVSQLDEVISTEQPCDLAYEFGDGMMDLNNYPEHFPKPAKHPWPFSDQVVIYVRHMGPGVMVGQAWQEGEALEQVPRKLCGEILMVKDYSVSPVTDTSE